MPRGGGRRSGGGGGGGGGFFSRRSSSTAAAAPPPAAARPGMGSGMGGMLMQGAALGAGAAVGSSMVHGAMGMMSGGGNKEEAAPQQNYNEARNDPYAAQPVAQTAPSTQGMVCGNELQQFMNCSQSYSHDLTMCQAFNDVYRQCKQAYGGSGGN